MSSFSKNCIDYKRDEGSDFIDERNGVGKVYRYEDANGPRIYIDLPEIEDRMELTPLEARNLCMALLLELSAEYTLKHEKN